ncbi:MAG TPA: STAS domain-containing protein [Vicinamibacterales bacterium]|nr:STAS domain-containing protein [Vicinamibacterales bacterium]
MSVSLRLCPKTVHILRVEGGLRAPVSRVLRHHVRTLLLRGERRIALDLSAVSKIDAAGVGELVRTLNMTTAAHGGLRIVKTTARVRKVLERANLFDLLSGQVGREQRSA